MTKIDELEWILLYVFSQNCEKGFQNARRRFGIQIKNLYSAENIQSEAEDILKSSYAKRAAAHFVQQPFVCF